MQRSMRLVILAVGIPLAITATGLGVSQVASLWTLRGELRSFEDRARAAIGAEQALRELDRFEVLVSAALPPRPESSRQVGAAANLLRQKLSTVRAAAAGGSALNEKAREAGQRLASGEVELIRYVDRALELAERGDIEAAQQLVDDDLRVLARSRIRDPLEELSAMSRGGEVVLPLIRVGDHWLARLTVDTPALLQAVRVGTASQRAVRLAEREFLELRQSPEAFSHDSLVEQRTELLAALREIPRNDTRKPSNSPTRTYQRIAERYSEAADSAGTGNAIAAAGEILRDSLVPPLQRATRRAEDLLYGQLSKVRAAAAVLGTLFALISLGAIAAMMLAPRWLTRHLEDPLRRITSAIGEVRDGHTIPPLSDLPAEFDGTILSLESLAGNLSDSSREVKRLANFDGVTGLPNRRLFMERLAAAVVAAQLRGHPLVVLSLQLSALHHVNQSLGHDAGDELLRQIAERLTHSLRQSDVLGSASLEDLVQVSRFGGGDFSVILSRIRDPQDSTKVAERLLSELERSLDLGGSEVHIQATVGIAVYPIDGDEAHTLLSNAYGAARLASERGRGQFAFHSQAMNSANRRKFQIGTRLRNAIDRSELTLNYQPVRDAKSEEITGAEALLRWTDQELGAVPPSEFIPIAEELGLIPAIGEWVLHSACAQVQAWNEAGYKTPRIAINVSAHQLRHEGWVQSVAQALEHAEITSGGIEIEITESALVHDEDQAMLALNEIREMGVSISLDDFGTGYSSLSYLQRFPIQRVKIDRSFVSLIEEGADNESSLAAAIVAMTRTLGVSAVAEGIETEFQARFMRDLGCEELQGFLYSPAVSAEAFAEMLVLDKPDSES